MVPYRSNPIRNIWFVSTECHTQLIKVHRTFGMSVVLENVSYKVFLFSCVFLGDVWNLYECMLFQI